MKNRIGPARGRHARRSAPRRGRHCAGPEADRQACAKTATGAGRTCPPPWGLQATFQVIQRLLLHKANTILDITHGHSALQSKAQPFSCTVAVGITDKAVVKQYNGCSQWKAIESQCQSTGRIFIVIGVVEAALARTGANNIKQQDRIVTSSARILPNLFGLGIVFLCCGWYPYSGF